MYGAGTCRIDTDNKSKQYDVIHRIQCTYKACRTPKCPSKCTYRSLSADPPTNKHLDTIVMYDSLVAYRVRVEATRRFNFPLLL